MKVIGRILMPALCLSLGSCTSLLPVNHNYEKAGTLGKGGAELSGHVTKYDVSHFGRTESSNTNYGLRAGYGITNRFDLKLRYEKMNFTPHYDNRLRDASYFSLVPKISAVPGTLSFLAPMSLYTVRDTAEGKTYRRSVRSISPQMIVTITSRKNQFDLSINPKLDYLFETGYPRETNLFFGISLGAGISSDLSRWAIRPEIGYAYDGQDARYFSYGVGLQFLLKTKR